MLNSQIKSWIKWEATHQNCTPSHTTYITHESLAKYSMIMPPLIFCLLALLSWITGLLYLETNQPLHDTKDLWNVVIMDIMDNMNENAWSEDALRLSWGWGQFYWIIFFRFLQWNVYKFIFQNILIFLLLNIFVFLFIICSQYTQIENNIEISWIHISIYPRLNLQVNNYSKWSVCV